MATPTIRLAAEAINHSEGSLRDDDLERIEQAANSIIATLDGQNGPTEEEALVLLFYCCNSPDPRESLAYFGSTITRKRLHYSLHDCEFITEAARLIEKDLGHEAIENGDMARDEEDIILAALKLRPSTVSDLTHHPASVAPAPSVISSTTPSMLAALDRVSGIQGILDKDKAGLSPSEAAKVVSFMHSIPERFGGRFPRPARMPEMPGYAEISLEGVAVTKEVLRINSLEKAVAWK